MSQLGRLMLVDSLGASLLRLPLAKEAEAVQETCGVVDRLSSVRSLADLSLADRGRASCGIAAPAALARRCPRDRPGNRTSGFQRTTASLRCQSRCGRQPSTSDVSNQRMPRELAQ